MVAFVNLLIDGLAILSLLGLTAPPSILVNANGIPSAKALAANTFEEFIAIEEAARKAKHDPKSHMDISYPVLADAFGNLEGFYHGVASGDPLPNGVIVWTRYTPLSAKKPITLELRMAKVDPSLEFEHHLDPAMNPNLKKSRVIVNVSSDFVAKIDVVGLESNSHYVFVFVALDNDKSSVVSSQVGQTRTAPALDDDVDELNYAFFSCSHFSNGYFHPYDIASTIKNLDFWIHVGDYIYEYGSYQSYATNLPNRLNMTLPRWEIVDLQDYRNRYATYHLDEGLQNLRRRAPMMSTWDDHEITNNSYGQGEISNSGAENHQEICPVNRTSSDEEKSSFSCDRDEGNIKTRFSHAAQAYMEWLPIRQGPGSMGVVDFTSITQVVEWGNLASFVAVDTRITDRSAEPTIGSAFNDFAGYAFGQTNMSSYYDPNSEVKQTFDLIAHGLNATMWNPEYTMVGEENTKFLMDTFAESKAANKTWQIFAAATMMGPHIGPNLDNYSEFVDPTVSTFVKQYTDAVLADPSAYVLRALVAMANTKTPWNLDGFDGFANERAKLIEGFSKHTNNPIILGGDLHNSWAWTLYESGYMDGKPRAVNLGCPGVTSPGWEDFLGGIIAPIADLVGGMPSAYKSIADAFVDENKGLVYADVHKKGFVAVKVTKTSHTAEYILVEPEDILSDFETARNVKGGITANFECGASLKTEAGAPGSLEKQDSCIIEFDTMRPAVWNLPVPEVEDVSGGSLLTDCGYDACEFDIDGGRVFKFVTIEGCLSGKGMVRGKRIRTRMCKGYKSQLWTIHDDGKISSVVNPNWCFAKSGLDLVIDKCDGDKVKRFGYNLFDKSLYLLEDTNMVVSTGNLMKERIKIASKVGSSNEHIELV